MKDLSIVDHYSEMDIDELEFELEDLNKAIENERIWLHACMTYEEMDMRNENIRKLTEEKLYVLKLIKELMVE